MPLDINIGRAGRDMGRFIQRTSVDADGCMIWSGNLDRDGYGKFFALGPGGEEQTWKAHRWFYGVTIGTPPPLLRHTCDKPACVHPGHLVPGTQADNIRDKVARGRQARGSRSSRALLNEGQVAVIKRELLDGGDARSIAKRYGVSKQTIYAIGAGRNWRHVEPAEPPIESVIVRTGT